MSKLFAAVPVALIVVVVALAGRSMIASGDDAKKDDELAQAKVRYAQARVKVAEAELRKAEDANRQAAGAIPAMVVQSFRNDVAMAKARLRFFEGGAGEATEAPYQIAARDGLAAAEVSLKQAMDENTRVPGTIDKAEVARREAEVELARARLEVCQQLVKATPEQQMQWGILVLQEEVHGLRFAVELLK